MLDAPAEVFQLGRHIDRRGGQFRREGGPLQPVQGQASLIHARPASGGLMGGVMGATAGVTAVLDSTAAGTPGACR